MEATNTEAPQAIQNEDQASPQPEKEIQPNPASPEQQAESPLHRQFAKLAQKEKVYRQQKVQSKELEEKVAKYEKVFDLARSNPTEFLKRAGVSLKDVLTDEVNQGQLPVEEESRREVVKLRQELEQMRQQQASRTAEQEEAKYQRLYNEFVDGVKNYVDNSHEYELIKVRDAYHAVVEVISEYHKETGEELPVQEAAKLVEQELLKEGQSYLQSSKLGKKVRSELSDQIRKELEEAQAKASRQAQAPYRGRLQTLTNDQQATRTVKSEGILPMDEAKKRAAALLRFNAPE